MLFGKDRFNQNNLLPDMIKGVDFIIEGPDRFGKIFLCRLRLREGFNLTHGIVRGEPDGPSCQSWQMRYLRFCIGRYQAFKRVKVAALHFFRSPPLAIKPGALSIEGQCLIRIAPQKRVSRKMLSPLNRFKQKRVAGVTAYGKKEGNRCQGIGQHPPVRSEEHTSELQSRGHIVCRLLLPTYSLFPYTTLFRSPLAIKPGALSIEGQCLIRIAPQKRVSRKMLSPLNRFKQKRVAGVTAYGKKEGNRCQGIGQHPPVDRDRSIILSQNIKCFSVHRPLKIKKPTPENCSGSIKKSIGKNLNQ